MDTDELLKLPPEDRKAALRAKYGKPATPAKTYGPELPPPPSAVTRPPGAAPSPPPVVREVNLPTRGMNQTDLDQAALRAASAERSAALQQGQSVEKADERALRAREGAYTVGPGADMLGADTVARAIYGGRPVPNVVRVYGPRVEAMPMVEPTKAERDAAYRATVREMDPIKMIMGEDAAPVDLPNEQDKKWARTAMANAGLSIAGGFFGGALPVWELGTRVAGAMGADVSGIQFLPEAALSPGAAAEAVYDYGADRDVQRLARVALPPLAAMSELPDAMVGQPTRNPYKDAAETATGIASRFGLGDAAGAVRGATGIDEGETALFWDDVRPRADFDAAATEYLNGSRAAVDALPLRALPARLRTEAVDVDKWIEMAKIDPELATIAEVADNDPAAIEKQVELLPIGLIMRYQPELRPTDSDLRKAIELRHERKRWRGNESFDAIGNIMAGGLVKPVKNGNDVLFVPSAWQHALRAAGAPWAATVVEADIHPFDMVPIPGVSRPDATAQDDQSWYAKWANLRLPSVYGVESAVRSGAFNDWLDVAGLNGGTRYADLASPESTWWGRTMADIATPEYANRGYQDVFLRAGGDPNGVAADVLGAADVVMQFLLPVEEAVAAPFGAAMRGVNRGRMARRVGRELGVTSPGPAVAAMVPILSGESDALNAFGHALNEETRDLIETGAMDPAKFTPRAKDEIRDVLRAARVENPDETADLILGWLADRRARVRDTSSEVATLGGPETQKMRDSNAYKDRERDLEDMARDPANGLRPADIPIIMRELEVQALNAVDAGEVPSTEAYFQRHSWTTGVEGEVLPVDTLYQERAPRPPTLAQQIRDTQFVPTDDIVNILGADRPAYLDEVSKFILEQREKVRNGKLAPRDVAKAYLITVASQNARSQSAAGVERLLGHRLDDRFIVMDQGRRFVRPEEATAAWLAEPIGKQTLDALDRGEWFQEGWDDFMRVRDAFGSNGVRTHGLLDAAPEGQISLRNVRDAVEGINAAGGDPAQVMDVLGKMRGIGTGKAPFIGHLLGFGEMPTMDAREIAAWMTGKKVVPADAPNAELAKAAASGKPPVSKAFMQRMIDGFGRVRAASGLGADLPSETFGAIMHHWLWDRIANEATTHEGVYHTMRYASESPGVVHGSIERVVPRDENLAAFMANSVVKNADGTPMVLYHGTLSPEFETFQPLGPIEMGAHVGTAEQANVRVADKARLAEQGWIPEGDGRVMPVYVNITNPLRVPDSGFDPESILANAMNPRYGEQAARIEAAGGRDMLAALEKLPQEQRARTLRGFLERLGYDGLVYENAAEGAGDSFAAFRPEQIKSATANVGSYDPTNPSILYSRSVGADPIERVATPRTETPEFKAWFGKSVVKDKNGPIVVYHGTNADFDVFDKAKAGSGPSKFGFWFTNKADFADMFGNALVPAYIKMENPKTITARQWDSIRAKHAKDGEWFAKWSDELRAQGHDGLRVKGGTDQLGKFTVENPDIYAVLEPTQIKSSIANVGTYDPANPSILRSAEGGVTRGSISPEATNPADVSRWLIKLFRTGDVRTALHEGAHLMTLMRPKFEAEAARIFDSVDGKLTTKGHEQLADAVTRLLRGRYRPGSKADNIAQDVLDALGDVWARVRTLPIVDAVPDRLRAKLDTLPDAIPAEFRVMWDRELHPKAAADGVAVRLTDERQPRRFPFAVNASADAAENIAEQKAARAGKARAYGSIERDPTQVQAALGITPGMKDVDPVDLMANVIAYIGVERLRREWGAVGELKTLPSNKTAVPAERHASVLKRAKSRRDGYFMGAEPAPIQGTNDLALDANAQAGLRRLIREVEVSPLGGNVPEAFRDPNADLSRVSMDDYNRLVAEQIDLYAGYGAWREKNAALAAVPGVVRLLNNVEAWGDRGTARVVLDKVREAFVVNTLPDQMLQPFQRDVITAFERTVPEAITEVQRALLDQARKNKKGDLSFTSADLVVGLAKSMGPEVVPTDTLDVLRAAEVVLSEPDLNMLVGNASVLDELFARAPLGEGAATQMRNEVDALGFLDYVVRNAETDGTTPADWLVANRANLPEHLQAATPDDANLILADQMSVVLDGVRRRSLAVDNTGHEIALMFAGSDDETLAKKIPNDGVRRRLFRDVYEQWYSGDHTTIFDTLTDAGYVVSGPDYDQGAAVLGTILRLNIRRKVATLAARLAEAGLTGDVANLTQAGFKYDRPFSAVAVRSPRDRFRSDVVDFITAQLGWQTQAVRRDGAYKAPLGDITSMGTSAFSPEGKAAYAEAMAQIAKWGFTPGSNVVKWNQVDLGGGQRVILPDIFESAITDLVNEGAPTFMARPGAKMDARVGPVTEGAAWARTIDQEAVSVAAQLLVKTYGYSVGMLHKGMLTGLGPAIRAGYYVGNAFGGVLQLYQRMGVIGATRVLAGSAADGSMVANVMRRLHDSGAYVDEPARTGRLLPDGRYITDQMLARDAARYGLNTSQAKTEWSTTLINEIRAEEPSTWNRVVKAGLADVPGARTAARAADVALDFPRRWRRWLDEGATAIDNYYRVSTYLDGLKRGLAADEAAQVARDVAFDWNALTKFEKNVARKIILFYSFQRRNQDLFWWTFLHHPSRVTGQLRLMYGMQEANLGEDSELYVSPFNEGRIILDARPPFKDNHVALAQQGAMTMTPSTNVNAAMGLWLDLMGVATFDPVAGESLMNRLNPFIAAPLALTVGYDVRRNRKIEDTSMAVPPGVADLDYAISSRIVDLDNAMNGGLLMQALDARPVPPRDDATLDYPGQIRFEVNRENPGAVRLFWGMMNLLPVASVERNVATMSRATGAGGYEPKAGTDAVEEAGRWLGVPTESIPTRAKVVGDLRERATADTEALEREAEKGSVTSGRGR